MVDKNNPVNPVDVSFSKPQRNYVTSGIDKILKSGMMTGGDWTDRFEKTFRGIAGTDHCVGLNSCTAGLEIMLRHVGVYDKNVLVPANTFSATACAALHAGANVEFVDSDPRTLSLDVDALEEAIDESCEAVLVVHAGGIITDQIQEIKAICDRHGAVLIEDCAQAHNARFNKKAPGSWGMGGSYSFYATKVLTAGDAGALVTDNDELAKAARTLRTHGEKEGDNRNVTRVGHNWRLNEFAAVVGVASMRRHEEIHARCRKNARHYNEKLQDVDGINPLERGLDSVPGYYKYVVYLDEQINKKQFKEQMSKQHVNVAGDVVNKPCPQQPVFQNPDPEVKDRVVNAQDSFSGATYISKNHVCLPVHEKLSDGDVQYVVDAVKQALDEVR